jgi:glycosyltransferase involved in cell wall biosynthesis
LLYLQLTMSEHLELSVVVPLYNERESVETLVRAVHTALDGWGTWELVLVDDGSRDGTPEAVAALSEADRRVRLVRLARNYGQSVAMQAGFDHARGEVVATMDGDMQNDPRDIPLLVAKLQEGYDLVAGYRTRRRDRLLTRKVPSWAANWIIRWMTGVPIRDNGCTLKAYRRELIDRIHLYSDMHRFIPALAAGTAGARIAELAVRHHPRRFGESKYGVSRVAKVLADLLTITMIRWFRDRPLAMFAAAAFLSTALALAFGVAGLVAVSSFGPDKANALVLPGSALLWLGLACYLLMLGLIGEVALQERQMIGSHDLPMFRDEGTRDMHPYSTPAADEGNR